MKCEDKRGRRKRKELICLENCEGNKADRKNENENDTSRFIDNMTHTQQRSS